MSEVLTSFQDRFPVDDCVFQFPLSAEVRNTVLAEFQLLRTERGKAGQEQKRKRVRSSTRADGQDRSDRSTRHKRQKAGHGCLRKSGKFSGSDDASLSCGRNHGVS